MYEKLTDEQLVYRIQKENDKEAIDLLLFRYENETKKIVFARLGKWHRQYFEYDDFFQLVRLTTLKVIKLYDPQKGSFYNYWSGATNRIITSEIRRLTKNNYSVEIRQILVFNDNEENYYFDNIKSDELSTVEQYQYNELFSNINTIAEEFLSPFEKAVLYYRMVGYSFNEIANKLKTTPKKIDNAMAKVRRKLRHYL